MQATFLSIEEIQGHKSFTFEKNIALSEEHFVQISKSRVSPSKSGDLEEDNKSYDSLLDEDEEEEKVNITEDLM